MSVLVALDSSETRLELLASARALAEAAGWPLRIVHVRSAGGGKLKLPAKLRADAEVSELDGCGGGADTARRRRPRRQGAGLRACATATRTGLGSVAASLLLNDPHPLFVLRPGMRAVTSMKRLLVPLEGSPSSSEAMRQADDAFCKRGREIVMLHVVTSGTPLEAGSMPAPRMVDQEHYEWAAWQEEFCMRFSQCPEGGRHRVAVRVGDPTELIPEEARTLRRRADRALVDAEPGGRALGAGAELVRHLALPAAAHPVGCLTDSAAGTGSRCRVTRISAVPITMLAMAIHCGCVSPSNQMGLRRRNSMGKRSAAGEHQEPAEHVPPRPWLARQPPEHPDDGEHDEDLVDGRGLHAHAGRRGHGAVRIAHRPGQVARLAVVAVAGELAADAADGVAEGHGRGDDVGHQAQRRPPHQTESHHGQDAADEAAVPGEAAAAEDAAPHVVAHVAQMLEQVVDARAHEAAHAGGDDDLQDEPVGEPHAVPLEQRVHDEEARHQERQGGDEAEAVEGHGADVEEDRVHAASLCRRQDGRLSVVRRRRAVNRGRRRPGLGGRRGLDGGRRREVSGQLGVEVRRERGGGVGGRHADGGRQRRLDLVLALQAVHQSGGEAVA